MESDRILTPKWDCVRCFFFLLFSTADHFHGVGQWGFQNKNRTGHTPHKNSYSFCWAAGKGECSIKKEYLIFTVASLGSSSSKQKPGSSRNCCPSSTLLCGRHWATSATSLSHWVVPTVGTCLLSLPLHTEVRSGRGRRAIAKTSRFLRAELGFEQTQESSCQSPPVALPHPGSKDVSMGTRKSNCKAFVLGCKLKYLYRILNPVFCCV